MEETMYSTLKEKIASLTEQFDTIRPERKVALSRLVDYIKERMRISGSTQLNFICTHNSRRSHIAQIWAQTAAYYYGIENVQCYSGGTEATAINPKVIVSLQQAGFRVSIKKPGRNPKCIIRFTKDRGIEAFSKRYDDPVNPTNNFAAVMVCSDADVNCPIIPGASERIALTYRDPKEADGTPQASLRYKQAVDEIGVEILYAFANAKGN